MKHFVGVERGDISYANLKRWESKKKEGKLNEAEKVEHKLKLGSKLKQKQ